MWDFESKEIFSLLEVNPKYLTPDTKIIILCGLVTKIEITVGHYLSGHHVFGIWQSLYIIVYTIRSELHAFKYPYIDTKIIILGSLGTKMLNMIESGGHRILFSFLEMNPLSANTPP